MLKVFALLALAVGCCLAYEKDGDVLVLGDDTLEDAIKEFPFLLVEFYAPWCGHCKNLAPEYAKAATTLSKLDTPVPIAKVDATEHSESASAYGVRGYPTLKWFVNGKATEYGGGRTADTIVSWVKKKTGPPCATLADKDAADKFVDSADVTVVAFMEPGSADFKVVEEAALGMDEVSFGVVADAAVAEALGAAFPSLVLFKKFDEGKAVFEEDLSSEAITLFVTGNSVPLVSTFSQESASKIFGAGITSHFLYFNKDSDATHAPTMDVLREVAADYKGKTLFVFVPHTEDRVLTYFDFAADDLPKAILVSLGDGDMKKFAFDKDLDAAGIKAHVDAYHSGELVPTLKSEDVPESNDGPVTVVVGKTFEEIVMDESKDVLVEFYAPWCGHCKKLAPTWDKLGEKAQGKSNVVIAKVDATANDIDHPAVNVRGFPTIIYFPHDDKANPVTYDGGRELEDFVDYLSENSSKWAESKGDHDEL